MTASPPAGQRCSGQSLTHGEPMAGTAVRGTRWLLIEHPGPWAPKPLDTAPLTGPIGAELQAAAAEVGAADPVGPGQVRAGQILLVRRPRHTDRDGLRRWFVLDLPSGSQVSGQWRDASDLAAAALALRLGPAHPAAEPARPGSFLLVCVHARRDACCALLGGPLAVDLAARWPEQVWRSSHLGGHRFAPTLLALPEGIQYGRLTTDRAEQVVADLLQGRVEPSLLRGRCDLTQPAQAAVVAAQPALQVADPRELDVRACDEPEPDRWRVEIADRAGRVVDVEVRAGEGLPAQQSCTAPVAIAPRQFVATVTGIRPAPHLTVEEIR